VELSHFRADTASVGDLGDQRQRRFDTSGHLIRSYVPKPLVVRPLGTVEAFVPVDDTRRDSGANFVVEWAGEGPTTEPLIETPMGTYAAEGRVAMRIAVLSLRDKCQ